MRNKLVNFVNSILNFKRIAIGFLAILLVLTTTACNPPAPRVIGEGGSYDQQVGQDKSIYDPAQPKAGGMNNYRDTNAVKKQERVDAKADRLVEQAKQNLSRRATNPAEAVENAKNSDALDNTADEFAEAGDRLKGVGKDVVAGTKRGLQNLKENASNADDIVDNVRARAAEDARRDQMRS